MIDNEKRSKLPEVLTLKAVEQRLPPHHPEKKRVMGDLKIKYAEVNGEREVNYTLGFLDKKKYLHLYNLRLPDHQGHFQMDNIILTENVILIVEVKNWQRELIFGPNKQVTRRNLDGTEEGYKNPVEQVKMQALRLQQWLRKRNYPKIPIEIVVVISFPQTIIQTSSPDIPIPYEVIHNSELLFRVQEIKDNYHQKFMPMNQLHKLAALLEKSHEPPENNVFTSYQIEYNDLIKGVFCPECRAVPMDRKERKWYCMHCGHYSKDAHKFGLVDYTLLIGNRISNKEARAFLAISSPYVTKMILKKEAIKEIGEKKGKVYQLDMRKMNIMKELRKVLEYRSKSKV